jgi:hypothetical protein
VNEQYKSTPSVREPGYGRDEESTEERDERLRLRAEERDREKKRIERFGK